jgi:tetratricopeptide (TPR) repeat protein
LVELRVSRAEERSYMGCEPEGLSHATHLTFGSKFQMKLSHRTIGVLILSAIVSTSGCGYINGIRAKSQLNDAVSAYKEKNYDIAEEHARKANELDPNNENAWLDLAIILSAEYRRGDVSPANEARAKEAIDLYKKLQAKDPNNDQAYSFVTVLLGYLAQTADAQAKSAQDQNNADEQKRWEGIRDDYTNQQTAWVQARADNPNVTPDRRSDALNFLAKTDFDCSYAITESKESKKLIQDDKGKVTVQYNKPAQDQYDKANQCIARGLEKVEKALSLDPNSDAVWSKKAAFLREKAKVAKWDKNDGQATDFEKQATDAAQKSAELKKANQPPPTPPPAT